MVFNCIRGPVGEDGLMYKAFENLSIPYVGPKGDLAVHAANKHLA